MAAPRFSIIMNVYNGERFLHAALASAFAQTYADWELIFWDDQSTDSSARILDPFRGDPRVRYFLAPERTPLGPAREQAIAQARGEWLAFLDQDDLWTSDKLERQARVIDGRDGGKLAIVYGRAMRFGESVPVRDFDHWHEFGSLPEGDIFASLFVDSCYICQSAACLRTDRVREVGPVPAHLHHAHDYFLYTELARRYEAACVQDVVCWYRVHSGAMSNAYYTQVQWEAIGITERWKNELEPGVYRRRLRIQSTMIGLREVTSGSAPGAGIARIVRDGSVPYLMARPFARGLRWLRRAAHQALRGVAKPPITQ